MGGSQSLRALEEAWRRNPEGSFVRLAAAYREHGRLEDAVRVVERGLTRRPGHLAGRVLLARVQLDRADLESAEAILAGLLEAHPDHWEAGWLLVRVRRADGRRDAEREALLDLRRLHPGHHQVEAALARLDADLAFRSALPDTELRRGVDPEALYGSDDDSTDLSIQGGNTDQLVAPPWKPAMSRKPGHQLPGRVAPPPREREVDPFLNATMAELLLAQGDADGAREMYRVLLRREPDKESHRARFLELGGEVVETPEIDDDEPNPRMLEELLGGLT